MQLPSNKSIKGYTLIELLITMAIMGILFTIGFLSFQDYSRQQALLSVVRIVQSDLRTAQQLASAGNKPSDCNGVVDGYQFLMDSSTQYTIGAVCSVNPQPASVKVYPFPADFQLSAINPNPIEFKTLSQGTNIGSGASATITITQLSTGKTRAITIGANGSIE